MESTFAEKMFKQSSCFISSNQREKVLNEALKYIDNRSAVGHVKTSIVSKDCPSIYHAPAHLTYKAMEELGADLIILGFKVELVTSKLMGIKFTELEVSWNMREEEE